MDECLYLFDVYVTKPPSEQEEILITQTEGLIHVLLRSDIIMYK